MEKLTQKTVPPADMPEAADPDLNAIANELGLTMAMPQPGSLAWKRLVAVCHQYISKVDYIQDSPLIRSGNLELLENSEANRRDLHDQLAVMLFGKKRFMLSPTQQNQASDFAALVCGRRELKGAW